MGTRHTWYIHIHAKKPTHNIKMNRFKKERCPTLSDGVCIHLVEKNLNVMTYGNVYQVLKPRLNSVKGPVLPILIYRSSIISIPNP